MYHPGSFLKRDYKALHISKCTDHPISERVGICKNSHFPLQTQITIPAIPIPPNHLDMKTSVQPRHPLKVWLPSSERPPWIHAGLPVKKKTIRARMQWMMVHHVRQFAQNPKAPPCLSQTRGWHGWACACHPCYRHIVGSLIFPMNHRLSASLDTQVVEKKVNSLSSAAPPLFMCSAI